MSADAFATHVSTCKGMEPVPDVPDDDMNYGTSIACDEPTPGHIPQEMSFRRRATRTMKVDVPSSSDEDEPETKDDDEDDKEEERRHQRRDVVNATPIMDDTIVKQDQDMDEQMLAVKQEQDDTTTTTTTKTEEKENNGTTETLPTLSSAELTTSTSSSSDPNTSSSLTSSSSSAVTSSPTPEILSSSSAAMSTYATTSSTSTSTSTSSPSLSSSSSPTSASITVKSEPQPESQVKSEPSSNTKSDTASDIKANAESSSTSKSEDDIKTKTEVQPENENVDDDDDDEQDDDVESESKLMKSEVQPESNSVSMDVENITSALSNGESALEKIMARNMITELKKRRKTKYPTCIEETSTTFRQLKGMLLDMEAALPAEAVAVYDKDGRMEWIDSVKKAHHISTLAARLCDLHANMKYEWVRPWFINTFDEWRQMLFNLRTEANFALALFYLDRALIYSESELKQEKEERLQGKHKSKHIPKIFDLEEEIKKLEEEDDEEDEEKEEIDPTPRCEICHKTTQSDKFCTCDCCERIYHTYCAVPKLDARPTSEWYCQRCKKRGRPSRAGTSASPAPSESAKERAAKEQEETERLAAIAMAQGKRPSRAGIKAAKALLKGEEPIPPIRISRRGGYYRVMTPPPTPAASRRRTMDAEEATPSTPAAAAAAAVDESGKRKKRGRPRTSVSGEDSMPAPTTPAATSASKRARRSTAGQMSASRRTESASADDISEALAPITADSKPAIPASTSPYLRPSGRPARGMKNIPLSDLPPISPAPTRSKRTRTPTPAAAAAPPTFDDLEDEEQDVDPDPDADVKSDPDGDYIPPEGLDTPMETETTSSHQGSSAAMDSTT